MTIFPARGGQRRSARTSTTSSSLPNHLTSNGARLRTSPGCKRRGGKEREPYWFSSLTTARSGRVHPHSCDCDTCAAGGERPLTLSALFPPPPFLSLPARADWRQRADLPVHQHDRDLHPLPGRGLPATGLPGDQGLHPGQAAPAAGEPAAGALTYTPSPMDVHLTAENPLRQCSQCVKSSFNCFCLPPLLCDTARIGVDPIPSKHRASIAHTKMMKILLVDAS